MLSAFQLFYHDLALLIIGTAALTVEIGLSLRPQTVLFEHKAGDKGTDVTVEFIIHDF